MSEPIAATAAELMATLLEPAAVSALGIREETVLSASIAISMKRIADTLANEGSPRGDLLHWLEQISMDIRAAGRG